MTPEALQQRRDLNDQVAQFEGLVYETARQIVASGVELEFDDVRQLLRIKILYAIQRYHPERSALSLRRFVFGAVMNVRKDIEERPRRFNGSIDALREETPGFFGRYDGPAGTSNGMRADRFDSRYLSSSAEQVYFEVEDEEPAFMATLSEIEREVVRLRAEGLTFAEIDLELGLGRDRARFVMQSVRERLGEQTPNAGEPRSAPMQPLPGADARTAHPRLARAA